MSAAAPDPWAAYPAAQSSPQGAQVDPWAAYPAANPAPAQMDTGQSFQAIDPARPPVPMKIDETTGGNLADRVAAGLKMTPEGQVSYLESRFGKGNVVTDKSGAIYLNDQPSLSGTPTWKRFNPEGFDFGDIASNVAPFALGALPVAVAGSNPLTAGAAAGAGNLLRQGVSALLPGSDNMSVGQRLLSSGVDSALGGATQYGVNKLFGGMDAMRPSNIIANYTAKLDKNPSASAADTLESSLNLPGFFSLGQRTGSKGVLTMEGMARRYPASADMMQGFDTGQVNTLVDKLNGELGRLDFQGWSPAETGSAIQNSFGTLVNKITGVRRAVATRDFGNVDMASGGKPVIPTDNLRNTIQGLVTDLDVPGGGDATASLVNRLKGIQADLSGSPGSPAVPGRYVDGKYVPGTAAVDPTPPKQLTGSEAGRLMQIYGNASKGMGQLFTDINSAQQRFVAGKVLGALGDDLDAAVQAGDAQGTTAQALRTARDNYKQNSQYLNTLQETTLGRLFNGKFDPDPEAVVSKIINMQPSQIKTTLGVLQTANPDLVSKVQASVLKNAMDKASGQLFTPATEAAIPGGVASAEAPFSAKKFLSNLPQGEQFDAFFNADPHAKTQIVNIARALQRVSVREGEGSPTAPLQWALDLGKGIVSANPAKIAQAGAQIITTRRLAQALTTPDGRQALMTLTDRSGLTGNSAEKMAKAAAYFTGMKVTEAGDENVRPPAEPTE